MDRRVALVAVAVVLLAGCSWVERPSNTPVGPTNTTSDGGQGIPLARLNAHVSGLTDESYELRIDVTVRTPNRSQDGTVHVRSDRDAEEWFVKTQSGNGALARYVSGGQLYSRVVTNGTTTYGNVSLAARNVTFSTLHRKGVRLGRLRTVFEFGEFESVGNVTRDGRRYERLRLTGAATGPNATVTLNRTAGEVLIGQDGVIRRATIDLRGTQDGQPFVYAVDYRITQVGDVSISPPEWLDRAREASPRTATDE